SVYPRIIFVDAMGVGSFSATFMTVDRPAFRAWIKYSDANFSAPIQRLMRQDLVMAEFVMDDLVRSDVKLVRKLMPMSRMFFITTPRSAVKTLVRHLTQFSAVGIAFNVLVGVYHVRSANEKMRAFTEVIYTTAWGAVGGVVGGGLGTVLGPFGVVAGSASGTVAGMFLGQYLFNLFYPAAPYNPANGGSVIHISPVR
ncbi:MAG: hypothetical protein ACR2RL_17980, partial [Gammaproteobacteria bacterium]